MVSASMGKSVWIKGLEKGSQSVSDLVLVNDTEVAAIEMGCAGTADQEVFVGHHSGAYPELGYFLHGFGVVYQCIFDGDAVLVEGVGVAGQTDNRFEYGGEAIAGGSIDRALEVVVGFILLVAQAEADDGVVCPWFVGFFPEELWQG